MFNCSASSTSIHPTVVLFAFGFPRVAVGYLGHFLLSSARTLYLRRYAPPLPSARIVSEATLGGIAAEDLRDVGTEVKGARDEWRDGQFEVVTPLLWIVKLSAWPSALKGSSFQVKCCQ